ALQIAFTSAGLRALGVAVEGFSPEFLTGMTEPSRSRRLGDIGLSDPRNWLWGSDLDAVVMIYAAKSLDLWCKSVQKDAFFDAFETVRTLATSDMGGVEPFGFADGISQPEFDWHQEQPTPATTLIYSNTVALGELLLGYPNEYGKYTD